MHFYRLDHEGLHLPIPAVWMPLRSLGGTKTAATLGFESLATRDPKVPLPGSSVLAADMHSDRTILLVAASDDMPTGVEPPCVVEVNFPDPHPPGWAAEAHARHQLLLVASKRDFRTFATVFEAMLASWVVRVPLILRAYPSGVGSSLPPRPD